MVELFCGMFIMETVVLLTADLSITLQTVLEVQFTGITAEEELLIQTLQIMLLTYMNLI